MRVKYPHPKSSRWAFMQWNDIPSKTNKEEVYLRRLRLLTTPKFSINIHWIYEPDTDRFYHDHPWDFWSWVLSGSYVESVVKDFGYLGVTYIRKRFSLHKMSIDHAHRIIHLAGKVVTLMVTGSRIRTWQFWTDDGKKDWNTVINPNTGEEI